MKITCTIPPFHFVHNSTEEFDLSDKPTEVSDEAFAHLCQTFGRESFQKVGEPAKPKKITE